MAHVKSDHFYLKMKTVTLKGLTSQPHLSLFRPRVFAKRFFFFQAFSAGRTRSVQICTTTRRKSQGGSLHHYLPNECSLPHSALLNAGLIPLSELGFHSGALKDVNPSQSQSNASISLSEDKHGFGQMRNGGSLVEG